MFRSLSALFLGGVLGLPGCIGGPEVNPQPVLLDSARTPEALRDLLKSIASRSDTEALLGRARIYDRLRALGEAGPADLLARGDSADLALLAAASTPEVRLESAGRLERHFLERADDPALRRSFLEGPLSQPLLRFVLLSIASRYGEYAASAKQGTTMEQLAEAACALADVETLKPEARALWHVRAALYSLRASETRPNAELSAEARKFCESDANRHLEEGTRAANAGTAEKVARGEAGKIMDWYLKVLDHFIVARECLVDAGAAQRNVLGTLEVVVRSLADMMAKEP